MMLRLLAVTLCSLCAFATTRAAPPTLFDLTSAWVDPNAMISSKANIPGSNRDLATINNFHGALGIAPQGLRPVDLFGVNALELPPFAACGSSKAHPYGCGAVSNCRPRLPPQLTPLPLPNTTVQYHPLRLWHHY